MKPSADFSIRNGFIGKCMLAIFIILACIAVCIISNVNCPRQTIEKDLPFKNFLTQSRMQILPDVFLMIQLQAVLPSTLM
jgi:hypothetical protein